MATSPAPDPAALPPRGDEAFRYADRAALARLWPLPAERIALAAGESRSLSAVIAGPEAAGRTLTLDLAAGARADLRVLVAGAAYGRIAIAATLAEGAELVIGAALVGGGAEQLELVTQVDHRAPWAISRQTVRALAGGRSSVSCLGKVAVAEGAIGTDAGQSIRALLLSPAATANARPELEIFADDVRCAHGCAVGELDPAALFYLAARGIPPERAQALMLRGFVAEAFAGAADEAALLAATEAALEQVL